MSVNSHSCALHNIKADTPSIFKELATIKWSEHISEDVVMMCLHAPKISATAKPGQFIMMHLGRPDLLLPRPMSIMEAGDGKVYVAFAVVGKGTKHLEQMGKAASDDYIDVVQNTLWLTGPLGTGFTINRAHKKIAVVGGGLGIPPLVMLSRILRGGKYVRSTPVSDYVFGDVHVDAYLGYRDEPLDYFTDEPSNRFIATDTGAYGFKGNVIDLLNSKNETYDMIYACGPKPMLRALSEYAMRINTACEISMEERMGCGVGTCVGCVADTTDGKKKICVDGPVFNSKKIIWT